MRIIRVMPIVLLTIILCSSCARDKKDWKKAVELNTIGNFEQFILKYPQSAYSDSASIRIEELAFNAALLRNNINDYRSFIEKYPESSFSEMAGNKIAELELSEAYSSKDILRVIEKINMYPESQPVKDMILKDIDSLEIKPKYSIHEDFTTKVLFSEKKNIIQFIIPPNRVIEEGASEIFDGMEIIQGGYSGELNLEAAGLIQMRSNSNGCTLQVVSLKNELLYALSDILMIGKNVYIKLSDNTYLYSVDEEAKVERVKKPNTFILGGGKIFLIKM